VLLVCVHCYVWVACDRSVMFGVSTQKTNSTNSTNPECHVYSCGARVCVCVYVCVARLLDVLGVIGCVMRVSRASVHEVHDCVCV